MQVEGTEKIVCARMYWLPNLGPSTNSRLQGSFKRSAASLQNNAAHKTSSVLLKL